MLLQTNTIFKNRNTLLYRCKCALIRKSQFRVQTVIQRNRFDEPRFVTLGYIETRTPSAKGDSDVSC